MKLNNLVRKPLQFWYKLYNVTMIVWDGVIETDESLCLRRWMALKFFEQGSSHTWSTIQVWNCEISLASERRSSSSWQVQSSLRPRWVLSRINFTSDRKPIEIKLAEWKADKASAAFENFENWRCILMQGVG